MILLFESVLIHMGETGKRFLWNVSASVIARTTVKIISFIVTIFIINYLGKEKFGIYSIVLNFSMVFMVMMDFGWVDMMIREISRHPVESNRYVSTYMIAQMGLNIFSILLFLLVILISGYETSLKNYLLIIAIGIFLFGFTRPFHSVLVAHESLDRIAFLSFICSILSSTVLFMGVIFKQPLVYFIWIFNVSIILQCIFYFLFARSKLLPWRFKPDLNLIRPIVLMSLPFTAILVLNALLKQLDVIILSKIHDPEICGLYAGANKFVFPLLMFSESVHWSVYPILSREKGEDGTGFQRALTKTGKYLLAMSGFMTLTIYVLAPQIITTLLNPEYHAAIVLLRVLVWYLPLIFLSRLLFYALVSLNRMKFLVSVYAVGLALFLILNAILVPLYSALGTAIAVVGTNALVLIAFWVIPARTGMLQFHLESLPQLFFSFIIQALFLVIVIRLSVSLPGYMQLFISGAAGGMSFVCALFLTGFINKEDRRQISSFFKRRNKEQGCGA